MPRAPAPITKEILREVDAQLFAPGSPFELKKERIVFEEKHAPHHDGIDVDVFVNGFRTLVDVYNIPKTRGYSHYEFLVFEKERLTFEETMREASALGYALTNEFGIERGDRVCICAKNRNEYAITVIGSTAIGGVCVPMNSWWKTSELEYGMENSQSKIIFCDVERYELILPIIDKLPDLEKIILFNGPGIDTVQPHPKLLKYNEVIAKYRGKDMPESSARPDDNALIMYTSGTTGHPKGVVLTHRGICHALFGAQAHNARQKMLEAARRGEEYVPVEEDPKRLGVLLNVPFFHATGLHLVFLLCFVYIRRMVIMSKWVPEEALQLIERERITNFIGVPTMVLDMMFHPNFKKYDTSSLEAAGGGGAAPPSTMVADIDRHFLKTNPVQGYGMTETNALTVLNDGETYKERTSSCGRPVPGVQVAIWDNNHQPVPPGVRGNVMIRGAGNLKEYWRKPEATTDTVTRDGWLHTGDIGTLDEEGFLHLGGRTKEIIIRGGENISCVVVENGAYLHPDVAEVAAIPVPHPTLGEEVGIVIYPKDGAQPSLEDIRASCQHLAKFEQPTHLYYWPEQLPRGATGKIVKLEIRDRIKTENLLSEQQKHAPPSKL